MKTNEIICTDALAGLRALDAESINCVVTSPPYWGQRDYNVKGQIGLEVSSEEYIAKLAEIFGEVKRVLKNEGTCFIVIGDKYSNKCLNLLPARLAIALEAQGWILRNELIWEKPNCLPQSVRDRFTVAHETIYFFTKRKSHFFNQQFEPHTSAPLAERKIKAMRGLKKGFVQVGGREQNHSAHIRYDPRGRNVRTILRVPLCGFRGQHFAAFPLELAHKCLAAGCPPDGIVCDPFAGSGTVAVAAVSSGRNHIGFDLNPKYVKLANDRVREFCSRAQISLVRP